MEQLVAHLKDLERLTQKNNAAASDGKSKIAKDKDSDAKPSSADEEETLEKRKGKTKGDNPRFKGGSDGGLSSFKNDSRDFDNKFGPKKH